MIWEVDEDMDKCVNYEELEKMYKRCSRDKEWVEPRKLFTADFQNCKTCCSLKGVNDIKGHIWYFCHKCERNFVMAFS